MSQRFQLMIFALLLSLCVAQKPDDHQVEFAVRACVASCTRELQLGLNLNKGNNISLKSFSAREKSERKKPVSVRQFQGRAGLLVSLHNLGLCENKCASATPGYMCFCRDSKCFPKWGCRCIKYLCEGPFQKPNWDYGKGKPVQKASFLKKTAS